MRYIILLCLLLFLLFCGAFSEACMLLAVAGVLCILFIAYVGIRAALDPDYEKRIKREAEEEKRKKIMDKRQKLLDSGYVSRPRSREKGANAIL